MKVLYFDAFAGAAGDMILGALLDAGAPLDYVRAQLDALRLDDWELEVSTVSRGGIQATFVQVQVKERGHSRTYEDISTLLGSAPLDTQVRNRSLDIFTRLGTAEARVHGVPLEQVHFHEVGSTDAIVDVVGAAAAFSHLAPERAITSPLPLGSGWVDTAHGRLPVPAPAVTELLQGVPVSGNGSGETVTPTGAAILMALSDGFGTMPQMVLTTSGYGAGTRDPAKSPNVLRVLVGNSEDAATTNEIVLECNIDDMVPELLPHVIDKLLQEGASDAWITPIVMKKGRPAFTLSALVDASGLDRTLDVILDETTTLGVRLYGVGKHPLAREWLTTDVGGAEVRVKVASHKGRRVTWSPEYDDAVAAAAATGLSLKEIYRLSLLQARRDEKT